MTDHSWLLPSALREAMEAVTRTPAPDDLLSQIRIVVSEDLPSDSVLVVGYGRRDAREIPPAVPALPLGDGQAYDTRHAALLKGIEP